MKVEYNTEEEKKEAFVEMLKEFEVTSTTKVRLCAAVGVVSVGGVVAQVAVCATVDSRACICVLCVFVEAHVESMGGAVTPIAADPA